MSAIPPADTEQTPSEKKKRWIPTWLGLLLMVLAVIVAGAIGLLLERLTDPTFR